MKKRLFSFVVMALGVVLMSACDMHGDSDLNHNYGKPGQPNSEAGQPAEGLFQCQQNSCFSGTQYCLRVLSATGTLTSANCQNFTGQNCRSRDCLTQQVRSSNSNCTNQIDFYQVDTKITLTCRH